MALTNRFVRSATWAGMADDEGNSTPELTHLLSDLARGGVSLTVEESVQVGEMMEARGVDAIELSGGLLNNPNLLKKPSHERSYFESQARLFKKKVRVPLMLVGGIRSLSLAHHIVSKGVADFVSFSRPLICEPDLVSVCPLMRFFVLNRGAGENLPQAYN